MPDFVSPLMALCAARRHGASGLFKVSAFRILFWSVILGTKTSKLNLKSKNAMCIFISLFLGAGGEPKEFSSWSWVGPSWQTVLECNLAELSPLCVLYLHKDDLCWHGLFFLFFSFRRLPPLALMAEIIHRRLPDSAVMLLAQRVRLKAIKKKQKTTLGFGVYA